MPVLPDECLIGLAGNEPPVSLSRFDQRQRDAVLDRSGRVVTLKFGQDRDVRFW